MANETSNHFLAQRDAGNVDFDVYQDWARQQEGAGVMTTRRTGESTFETRPVVPKPGEKPVVRKPQ